MNTILFVIYAISALSALGFAFTHHVHMFQLGAYKYVFHKDWIRSNFRSVAAKALLPLVSFVLCLFGGYFLIAGCVFNILFLLANLPKKAKKPLVFTTRVKRLYSTAFIVFVLLLLVSVAMLGSGVSVFVFQLPLIFTSHFMLLINLLNRPLENAVRKYYINSAKKKIDSLPGLIVIGITGSYGKTGTKYILNKLLSEKYNVLMTPASYNTTMGVVKVVRENLTAAHDIFICEMGARNPGEIKEICDIVKPKYGIITSIGPCHLETFGTIENIIKTKFELCDALPEDGIIFLNADNEHIASSLPSRKAVYYGIKNREKSDFTAEIMSLSEKGTTFTAQYNGDSVTMSTKLLGAHNILNILGCVSLAKTLGVDNTSLVLGAKRIEGAPHRLSLIKGNGFVIIDDSFNSNPSGTKAALEVLSGFDGIKTIITPGMIELGKEQDRLNGELGEDAAKVCDYIYLVGEKQTRPIKLGAIAVGFPEERIVVFERVEDAITKAKSLGTDKRSVVLIENDLPDNF